MSKIPGKGTKPEIIVRKFLFSKGFRYRINDNRYSGTPDIVLPKYHTMIFINGCFWHGHENCKAAKLPKTNSESWEKKILDNIARDTKNMAQLEQEDWKVIIIWQCELKNKNSRERRLELLINEINNLDRN